MKCDFVVGQQVVCVNDDWPEETLFGVICPQRVPMLNEVLTISSISPCVIGTDNVFLQFQEIDIRQDVGFGFIDVSYNHSHFQPLQTRKTDISVFTALLTPAGKVPVDA